MRCMVLAIGLVACYRPSLRDECTVRCGENQVCPSDSTCSAGVCVGPGAGCTGGIDPDANGLDATKDVLDAKELPTSCRPTAPFVSNLVPVSGARDSYTSYAGKASFVDNEGDIVVGPDQVTSNDYERPRLAPSGDEVFLHRPEGMHVSELVAGSWTVPRPVATALNNAVEPGTVSTKTAAAARRMVVTNLNGLFEGSQTGADTWTFFPIAFPDKTSFSSLYDPSLSPDALRLIFVGRRIPDGASKIWMTLRDSIIDAWQPATLLLDYPALVGGNAYGPFLSEDCSRLYFGIDRNAVYYSPR